jgi:hypothetical protein
MLEVIEPLRWPSAPKVYSFSALHAISECPRRWAYSRAEFAPGGLANERGGLIRRASWSAIRGEIIHETLKELLEIHRREAGPPPGRWELVTFWARHLPPGGIPFLVSAKAVGIVERRTDHPRNLALRPGFHSVARREAATLVASVNGKLVHALAPSSGRRRAPDGGVGARVLRPGAAAEVRLECSLSGRSGAYAWVGDVDVLKLTEDQVEIIDYKTGEAKDAYRQQVELYALLLARDRRFNPSGLRATTLSLIYESGRCDRWPGLGHEELAALEERIVGACGDTDVYLTGQTPPQARVGEACLWCDAKPICAAYWASASGAAATSANARVDAEVTVSSVARDHSEVGTTKGPEHARYLLAAPGSHFARDVRPGDVVRIVGGKRVTATQEEGESASGQVYEIDPKAEVVRCPAPIS